MENTWNFIFSLKFFNSRIPFLAPFTSEFPKVIGYLVNVSNVISSIRMLTSLLSNEKFSYEVFFVTMVVIQIALRGLSFLFKKNEIDEFCKNVKEFLQENESDPITRENQSFLKVWKKTKPKFVGPLFWNYTFILIIWLSHAFYKLIRHPEKVTKPLYVYYSPFLTHNNLTKWAYTVSDCVITAVLLGHGLFVEIIVILMLTFLKAQFIYLQQLIEEIFDGGTAQIKDETLRWWIRNHASALR